MERSKRKMIAWFPFETVAIIGAITYGRIMERRITYGRIKQLLKQLRMENYGKKRKMFFCFFEYVGATCRNHCPSH